MTAILFPMSRAAAKQIAAESLPSELRFAPDYPTEFSQAVAQAHGGSAAELEHVAGDNGATSASPSIGPFFIVDDDGVVVGEIGGHRHEDNWVEIGYAVVPSRQGRGLATRAVLAIAELVLGEMRSPPAEGLVAHTPTDRPASARVLEKAGFLFDGEVQDDAPGPAGEVMWVRRWRRTRHA